MEYGIEHIIRVIDGRRAQLGICKKKLVKGICTADMFSKIIMGQGRKLDKLEIDALMQRVGYNAKNCNCLLDIDEYVAFVQREKIREGIEHCYKDIGSLSCVKNELNEYKRNCRSNAEKQVADYFEVQLMCISGSDNEVQLQKCLDAIRITIDDFCLDDLDKYLYSEIEILLVTRLLCVLNDMGKRDIALCGYEKLLQLMESDRYLNNESMRFFVKIIYDASLTYMEERQYGKVSGLCRYAIDKLPKENKFRYLPEMYELKARADASMMIIERGYDESLFQTLYEESRDYKYYKNLSYIPDRYPQEYSNDIKCPMYREYRVVFVGDIIRQRRKLLKLTQSELVYYINSDIKAGTEEICSEKTLSRLENGRGVTSWRITRKLLSRLKLPPERYFFDYVADDYSLIEELRDIERSSSAEEYEGLLERCEAVEKANPLWDYPYNRQRIEEIVYKINRRNNMVSDEEAQEMIVEALERTMPKEYLMDDTCIYLFLNEQLTLGNIIQNLRKIEGEKACLVLMEKMIKGCKDTSINENVCALNIISLKRKYEGYTANTGDLEKACILAEEGMREAVKHNLLGVISPYIYDAAWNRAEMNQKDEELKKMLKCVFTASTIRCNIILQQFSRTLYRNVFDENIDINLK